MKSHFPLLTLAGLGILTALPARGASVFAQWNFNDVANGATTVSDVGGYVGSFAGTGGRSADGGGVSGTIGDYAYSPGSVTGSLTSNTASFLADLNALTGGQQVSITYWQNLASTPNSTVFWGNSAGANGSRGLSAHSPWSDGNTYFDTSGCCDPNTRISGALGATVGTWEMMTFVYDNGNKAVYRNTTLITSGADGLPLNTDFDGFYIGNDANGTIGMDARIDLFTIWNGALTTGEIAALVPEPATALLGLVGGLGLAFRRRRED